MLCLARIYHSHVRRTQYSHLFLVPRVRSRQLRRIRGCLLTQGIAWQDLYKAAMLEVDQSKLRERIEAANAAIQRRIEDLKLAGNHDETSAERHSIAEALDSLRMLRKLEVRPSPEANREGGDTRDGGSS